MVEDSTRSKEVFEAVQRWWRAWVEKDLRTVKTMVASDYSEISASGRLKTLGARELLDQATQSFKDCSITEWELFDPVTRIFDRVVVCSYVFRIAGTRGDKRFVYEGRATDVLSKKEDVWTLVSHEGTLNTSRLVS